MKHKILLIILAAVYQNALAQTPNFNEHVAPIIYNNCTKCHRQGDIAPFTLESYSDVFLYQAAIKHAVSTGEMPPWPPDTTYQRYTHERFLSQEDKNTIIEWVDNGAPQGDPNLKPPLPEFSEGSVLGQPDLQLSIATYESKAAANDEYKCFFLPVNINSDRFVKAIEIMPGNREIVHHALVYYDESGEVPNDGACNVGTSGASLMTGYTPGAMPTIFPNGESVKMGMKLAANSVVIIQIHYPQGTAGMIDSTKVNFHLYPEGTTGVRQVSAAPILKNWLLNIPANTVKDYDAIYPPLGSLPADFSILSVFPHMHLIGRKIHSYAVDANGDTIPFIRINNWDFEWQGFYDFRKVIKLPKGTKMYAHATYDNTTNNPFNPSNPPQDVRAGEATTDEMFLVYFHYLPYEPGDEYLQLDTLLNHPNMPTSVINKMEQQVTTPIVYPNPFTKATTIQYYVDNTAEVTLKIYDIRGGLVDAQQLGVKSKGYNKIHWRTSDAGVGYGIYFYRLRVGDSEYQGKLVYMNE